jgi:hypothetical protein
MTARRWQRVAVGSAILLTLTTTAQAGAVPTWQPETVISSGESVFFFGTTSATDGRGNTVAVWLTRLPGAVDLVRASWHLADGSGWSAPTTISGGGVAVQVISPHVEMAADGTATAVWVRNNGQDNVVEASSAPLGGPWSTPEQLSTGGVGAAGDTEYSNVAVAANGDTTAVWVRSDGTNRILQAARRVAGGHWDAPVDLSAPGVDAIAPEIAVDAAGRATVAWSTRNVSDQPIVLTRSRSTSGTWTTAEQLGLVNSWIYDVVIDKYGTATAVWQHFNTVVDVVSAATRPADGPWSSYVPLSSGEEENWELRMGLSPGTGDVTLLLGQYRGVAKTPVLETVFHPANGSWGPAVDLPGAVPDDNLRIAIGVDDTGTATAVWSEGKNELVASRRKAFDLWSAPVPVATSLAEPSSLSLSAGGPGDAVLVWAGGSKAHAAGLDAQPPTITSFVSPATGTATVPAAFAASSTDTWSPVSYSWSFGDGATGAGASVTHAYAGPGTYAVSLTATDGAGNATTQTKAIVVAPAPVGPLATPEITTFSLNKHHITRHGKARLKVGLTTAATLRVVLRSKHTHLVHGKHKRLRVVIMKSLPAGIARLTIKGSKLAVDTWKIRGTAKNSAGTSAARRTRLVVRPPA